MPMKKLPVILTIGLIVIVASVFGVVYHYQTKTKYNESYVNGNTAGNLYNAGLSQIQMTNTGSIPWI